MQENIKRIIAVRHGQSVGNIARHEAFLRDNNSFYEDPNFLDINPDHYELSQLGVEQSKKAGEFLRQVLLLNPGVYFSSNNFRTRQTAAYVFPDAILNINEPLLRERNYAGFDKLTKDKVASILAGMGSKEKISKPRNINTTTSNILLAKTLSNILLFIMVIIIHLFYKKTNQLLVFQILGPCFLYDLTQF